MDPTLNNIILSDELEPSPVLLKNSDIPYYHRNTSKLKDIKDFCIQAGYPPEIEALLDLYGLSIFETASSKDFKQLVKEVDKISTGCKLLYNKATDKTRNLLHSERLLCNFVLSSPPFSLCGTISELLILTNIQNPFNLFWIDYFGQIHQWNKTIYQWRSTCSIIKSCVLRRLIPTELNLEMFKHSFPVPKSKFSLVFVPPNQDCLFKSICLFIEFEKQTNRDQTFLTNISDSQLSLYAEQLRKNVGNWLLVNKHSYTPKHITFFNLLVSYIENNPSLVIEINQSWDIYKKFANSSFALNKSSLIDEINIIDNETDEYKALYKKYCITIREHIPSTLLTYNVSPFPYYMLRFASEIEIYAISHLLNRDIIVYINHEDYLLPKYSIFSNFRPEIPITLYLSNKSLPNQPDLYQTLWHKGLTPLSDGMSTSYETTVSETHKVVLDGNILFYKDAIINKSLMTPDIMAYFVRKGFAKKNSKDEFVISIFRSLKSVLLPLASDTIEAEYINNNSSNDKLYAPINTSITSKELEKAIAEVRKQPLPVLFTVGNYSKGEIPKQIVSPTTQPPKTSFTTKGLEMKYKPDKSKGSYKIEYVPIKGDELVAMRESEKEAEKVEIPDYHKNACPENELYPEECSIDDQFYLKFYPADTAEKHSFISKCFFGRIAEKAKRVFQRHHLGIIAERTVIDKGHDYPINLSGMYHVMAKENLGFEKKNAIEQVLGEYNSYLDVLFQQFLDSKGRIGTDKELEKERLIRLYRDYGDLNLFESKNIKLKDICVNAMNKKKSTIRIRNFSEDDGSRIISDFKSEPLKSEKIKSEPLKSEKVKSEKVKSEKVKSEKVKSEKVKNDERILFSVGWYYPKNSKKALLIDYMNKTGGFVNNMKDKYPNSIIRIYYDKSVESDKDLQNKMNDSRFKQSNVELVSTEITELKDTKDPIYHIGYSGELLKYVPLFEKYEYDYVVIINPIESGMFEIPEINFDILFMSDVVNNGIFGYKNYLNADYIISKKQLNKGMLDEFVNRLLNNKFKREVELLNEINRRKLGLYPQGMDTVLINNVIRKGLGEMKVVIRLNLYLDNLLEGIKNSGKLTIEEKDDVEDVLEMSSDCRKKKTCGEKLVLSYNEIIERIIDKMGNRDKIQVNRYSELIRENELMRYVEIDNENLLERINK